MSKTHSNRQLEPKKNPECTPLEKDSKTGAEQSNCNCEEVR